MNEKFSADVKIESKWVDYSEKNNYDPETDWNPMLSIENLVVTTSETVSYNVTKENGYKCITETRHTSGSFFKNLIFARTISYF